MGLDEIGTILVVDDEQPILDYVARILGKSGYHVVTALSGEDALVMVDHQNLTPEVLISDLGLPGMSGFTLADEIRRAKPNTRVLFMSGSKEDEYFRQMQVSTADIPFLQKPFTVADLLEKVQELLTEHRTQREYTIQD